MMQEMRYFMDWRFYGGGCCSIILFDSGGKGIGKRSGRCKPSISCHASAYTVSKDVYPELCL